MSNYNYVNRVLIGDGTNVATITSLAGIKKGDLFMLKENGLPVVTNAAAAALPKYEKVTIAAGIGDGLAILSSPIQGNTVSKYEGKSFVAPSERVVILGYNGTAATGVTLSAGNQYRLRVLLKDIPTTNGQQLSLGDTNYTVGTGVTPATAASNIAKAYDLTEYGAGFINRYVKLERVSNGTRTVLPGSATVTKGSKSVLLTAHALTVGTPVRLDTVAQGTSSPVYLVASVVSANEFTLDVPYKGATGTIVVANSGSLASVTEWGFKLSGIPVVDELPGYSNYEWVNYQASFGNVTDLNGDTAAVITLISNVNPGQGYYKQVRDNEEKAKGYLGDTSKRNFDATRIASNVVVDAQYASVVLTHSTTNRGDFQGTHNSPLKTEIYIPTGSAQATGSGDNFLHVLNGFFGTSIGFPVLTL